MLTNPHKTADILTLNKILLTENFILFVVNIIGFTTESCKFLLTPNSKSLVYFMSIDT